MKYHIPKILKTLIVRLLRDIDYGDVLPYKTWKNEKAMESAMSELMRFGKKMFPGTQMSVYVPPSNVLSEQGRKMLAKSFRRLRR